MFIILLGVTFLISLIVSLLVAQFFDKPVKKILGTILESDISLAWSKYLKFAIYVVGISNGVRIWELEKYISPSTRTDGVILILNAERWILEAYRSVISSLQGIAWMLLVFFVFTLIAYVIVKVFGKTKNE